MRKLMMASLIAAVAMPAAIVPVSAEAQTRREMREERRDLREERRELRRAERRGDWRDVRRERRDVRDARRDVREARSERRWNRSAWRDHRRANRGVYARGNWRAPFRYRTWQPGIRIAPSYYGQRYWISNPGHYRLPAAGRGQRWVRHYDDVLLIDYRRGVVIDVIRDFYW